MLETLLDPQLWKYASIPLVAGVVGWGTNWVAIKLTFWPLDFIGLRPLLGWQGIIPSKAAKMAATFHDSTMSRLGELPEVYQNLEPEKIAAQVKQALLPRLDGYTDEILQRHHPLLWGKLPELAKRAVYAEVRRVMPPLIDRLVDEVGEQIDELIDFKRMLVERLDKDKALLNRLFLECGEREFAFIIRSGFYFGLLFGLVQLAVWVLYPEWWILPFFGLLVGWATNWIAINVIFRPLHPVRLGPFSLQGLFLKRQPQVAKVWCRIVTREILTLRSLVDAMLNGPHAARTAVLIRQGIEPVVDRALPELQTVAHLMLGSQALQELRLAVGDKAVAVSELPFDDWNFNHQRAAVIEEILRARMVELPTEEFQDLLRPCFQEEELKLILVGAVLGCAAGFAQLFLVFGGG